MTEIFSRIFRAGALAVLLAISLPAVAEEWAEYENPATGGLTAWSGYSTDPRVESRRTDHFLIRYGHERQEGLLVEQTAQGHLQYLENCYDTWLALGFTPGLGGSGPTKYKSVLHVAKTFPGDPTGPVGATGFGEGDASGWASGCCVPTSYLGYRNGNGATPHEFGHGWGTRLPSSFSESVANWIEQQAITGYPGDWCSVGMPMGHMANYYNNLSLFNYFMEAPGYGAPFLMKLFYDPNLNAWPLNPALDDIVRKAVRCDTSGATDKAGAIHDGLGRMNAKMLDMDFWNHRVNNGTPYDTDLTRQGFHFNRIPMVRQPGVAGTWYRPEFSMIPQILSNNFIPLTVTAAGSPRTVACDFRPVADAVRGTSFRACFVAFNMNKEPRYSAVWNAGVKSFTLADDENAVYLAIIACPYAMNADLLHNDYTTDHVAMFPYRLSLTGAVPKGWQWPAPTSGFTTHPNGGGIKANTATVDASAYVGPNAMVLGTAKVYGNSRIEDYAVVDSSAIIGRSGQADDPVVSGHAYVTGSAQVYGHGKVRDYGWVLGTSKVHENALVMSHSVLNGAQVFGNAVLNQTSVRDPGLCYSGSISGCAIIGGDTSGGNAFDKGVYCEYPAMSVLDNAYQYLGYNFEKKSCVFAMDQYGMNHSYLMGEPQVVSDTVNGTVTNVLELDGATQYVELRPDAADFADLTVAAWVKWSGSANDQVIFSTGDGGAKYMSLTPKAAATGFLRFAISDGTATQYLEGTSALPNAWTHVAVTLSANTGTLYVNGAQVAQNTGMTVNPDQLHAPLLEDANFIGRNNAGRYFSGRIDEFKVLNKALSATEVSTLRNTVAAGTAPAADTAAPAPATAAWLVAPKPAANHSITMSAVEGTDAGGNGVLYYFRCVTDATHDSGWISENTYTDFQCADGTPYTYAVKMKDRKGNTGTESAQLGAATPAADAAPPAPNAPTFSSAPRGISTTAISMTATPGTDDDETVLYKFTRSGSAVTSGWTSRRTWTDTGLTAGNSYAYTLQMKDGHGNTTSLATSPAVVARDDSAPALDADFRLQWGILPHTQLDKTVRMVAFDPVEADVEYYFECVESSSTINSGWTATKTWVTPALADGTWNFRYKLRDKSPQRNQSAWSVPKSAKVLPSNSYHAYALAQLAALPDSTLVQFSGKVTRVNAGNYTVSSADGLTSITVVPRTYYTATDALLLNRTVDVKGHLWTYDGTPKRVTEAFVRGNPQSGKIEFENCEYTDETGSLRSTPDASGLEFLGGFPDGYSVTIANVAATAQMTVGYRGSGPISLYVNGTHSRDLALPNLGAWGTVIFTGLTIPAGATLRFQRDAGDAQPDLDFLIVGPVYPVSGKVTSAAGGAAISGATVYFSDTPNAAGNPLAATVTTDASGNYTYSMRDGTWYVCAGKAGYNTSADRTVVVSGGAMANINFALVPNVTVAGKVTDKNGGAAVAGASIYFASSPGGVPAFTAAANASGDYSQAVQDGTWYVHAGKTGYYPTFEQVVVVNGVALAGVNFQLEANPQVIPQAASLYFHVTPDSFTAAEGAQTGNWQLQVLEGVNVSADPTKYAVTGGSPSMEVRGAIKWERNKYADMEGYEVQNRSMTPILPFNGGTFVAVVKPTLFSPVHMGYGGQYILNVGYNGAKGLAIILLNDTGQLRIIRNGSWYTTDCYLPDGQKTVLTCVVQPDGSFKLYANGIQVYAQAATSSFVNIDLSGNASYQKKVTIGEGAIWLDGSACYNGNIGDVLVYYAPLGGTDRAQLEAHLMKKFAIGGITITATAGPGGTISPAGSVLVPAGGSQTFTIAPNPGYAIQTLLVDGVSTTTAASYTFTNVTANHTIRATFMALASYPVTGTVTDGKTGLPVAGATVYIASSPSAVQNALTTATTNAAGVFTVNLPDGAWYFAAAAPNYYASPDRLATVAGAGLSGIDMTIAFSGRNIPRTADLLFGCVTDSFPGSGPTGPWAVLYPAGMPALVPIGAPAVEVINGVKWEKNLRSDTANTGYRQGTYNAPIPCAGVTIVAAVRPAYTPIGGEPRGEIVDCFYGELFLAVAHGTGEVIVNHRGYHQQMTGYKISDGEAVVLSLVVQPGGDIALYANGERKWTASTGEDYTQLVPTSFKTICVGRNDPDGWSAFNGNIGDVFLYATALNEADRQQLEADLASKFGIGPAIFQISASAGPHGTIAPAGNVPVTSGTSQSFAITPDTGYAVSGVLVDGVGVGPVAAYTFNQVTADHTIAAAFVLTTRTITASAGTGGTISPSGVRSVNYGTSLTLAIAPAAGYIISDVLVDGVSVGAVDRYSFTNVTANHTIAARFQLFSGTAYTITASAGTGGTISPVGAVTVPQGASRAFTITPAAGYSVRDVKVDGVSKGALRSYSFSNVSANHTIAASFAPTAAAGSWEQLK